jgi:hypothetical protein
VPAACDQAAKKSGCCGLPVNVKVLRVVSLRKFDDVFFGDVDLPKLARLSGNVVLEEALFDWDWNA